MEKEVVLATGVAVLKPSVLRMVILMEASRQGLSVYRIQRKQIPRGKGNETAEDTDREPGSYTPSGRDPSTRL